MLKIIAQAVLPRPVLLRVRAKRQLSSSLRKAEPEIALLPSLCDPARMAIDVGASIGVYAYHLRRLASQVVAFEPNPDVYRTLVVATGAATSLGRARLCALQVALSDRAGTAALKIPENGQRPGLGTIERANDLDSKPASEITVETRTLDSYAFDHVGLIKIDVEGHERAVLDGARDTIVRYRPNLVIEAEERHHPGSVSSIHEFMKALGYRGSFLLDGTERPFSDFTPSLQDPKMLRDGARKIGTYINNFIFRPD